MSTQNKHIPPISTKQENRFWSLVDIQSDPDACWPWKLSTDMDGYGTISVDNIRIKSHRLSFFLANGRDPQDYLVCHTCDNPPCCNPFHLFLGTCEDNLHDASLKGRMKSARTEFSETDVANIRIWYRLGIPIAEIAGLFDVTDTTISNVANGRSFHYLPGLCKRRGGRRKLSDIQVLDIRARYSSGENTELIASIYNITRATISAIATGRLWPKLPGVCEKRGKKLSHKKKQ